jgi:peroxiredoxin
MGRTIGRLRQAAVLALLLAPTLAGAVTPGDRVPAFRIPLLDGGAVDAAALAGGPALLVFFSVDCADCDTLMPGIRRTHGRYAAAGLRVVAIAVDAVVDVRRWRQPGDPALPVAADGRAAADAFGVSALPTWFVIDAAGVVRHRSTASDPEDPLLDLIPAELLGIDPDDCGVAVC